MIDLLTSLGRFCAHADASTRAWLPLSDTGLDGAAMGALLHHGLAERDGDKAVYRLTAKGRAEAEGLGGDTRFSLDGLLASARRTCQPNATRDATARCAVLLTCDDDLRSALRTALCEVLAYEEGALDRNASRDRLTTGRCEADSDDDTFAGFELFKRPRAASSGGSGSNGSAPDAPNQSRWERAGDALRSRGIAITTGPNTTKPLADCTADDLRAASAYYAGVAVASAKRSRMCDALIEAMATYEAATVAELEAAAPDRIKELLA